MFPNFSSLRGLISVEDSIYKWYLIGKCVCRAYETMCVSACACIKITGQRWLQYIIYLLAQIYLPALVTPDACLSDFVPRENFSVKNCVWGYSPTVCIAGLSGTFKLKSNVPVGLFWVCRHLLACGCIWISPLPWSVAETFFLLMASS